MKTSMRKPHRLQRDDTSVVAVIRMSSGGNPSAMVQSTGDRCAADARALIPRILAADPQTLADELAELDRRIRSC